MFYFYSNINLLIKFTSKRVPSVLSQNASGDYNFRQTCLEAELAVRHDNTYRIINDLIN